MFRERFYSLRIERNLVWNMEANVVSRDKISLRFHEHRIVYKHAFYTLQRTRGIARAYNLPWCLSNVYKISLSLYTYIYTIVWPLGEYEAAFLVLRRKDQDEGHTKASPCIPLVVENYIVSRGWSLDWLLGVCFPRETSSPTLLSVAKLSPLSLFPIYLCRTRRIAYVSNVDVWFSISIANSFSFSTRSFLFFFRYRSTLHLFVVSTNLRLFFFVFTRSSLRAFLLFLSFAIVLQTKTFWHGAYSNPPCCGWLLIWLLIYASLWRSSYASSLPSLVPHLSASK